MKKIINQSKLNQFVGKAHDYATRIKKTNNNLYRLLETGFAIECKNFAGVLQRLDREELKAIRDESIRLLDNR
jgi:hypothetical protein